MPDLQSELSKLATVWDAHESAIRTPAHAPSTSTTPSTTHSTTPEKPAMQTTPMPFMTTGNLSRDLFTFVQRNAHIYTPSSVVTNVVALGFNKNSVSSLITQMQRGGLLRCDVDGKLFATLKNYKPFKTPYRKRLEEQKAKLVRKAEKQKAKLQPTPAPAAPPTTPPSAGITALSQTPVAPAATVAPITPAPLHTAESVLQSLSVAEAYKVFVELKKMFEGK